YAVGVADFEDRIGQRRSDAGRLDRQAKAANDDVVDAICVSDGEPGNEAIVTGAGKSTCGNVRQFGVGREIQIVDFKNAGTGAAVGAAEDCGVSAGVERGD